MAVPYGQTGVKGGYKTQYDPVSTQAQEFVDASRFDGGKSVLSAITDGSALAINESFEKLGMNKLAMEWEAAQRKGEDQQMVSVKDAEEKWGLQLDEPIPLHEALFLNELNQESTAIFEKVLTDLSFRHGPVNFLGAVAGTLGTAALLPSNWLGVGLAKHVTNIPRYYKLLTLAKRTKKLRRATDAAQRTKLLAAQQALKTAAAKPLPILPTAGIVGAENVVYAHLKESEGIKTDKALAFGIGAGAGLFFGTVAKALTKNVDELPQIPKEAPAQKVPADALGPRVPKHVDEHPVIGSKEEIARGGDLEATVEITPKQRQEDVAELMSRGISEQEARKFLNIDRPDKLKVEEPKAVEPGTPAKVDPVDAHVNASATRVNESLEDWWRKLDEEAAAYREAVEPSVVKPEAEFTPEQKSVMQAVKQEADDVIDEAPPELPLTKEQEVAVKAVRDIAEQEGAQEVVIANLDNLPNVPKRNEAQLIKDVEKTGYEKRIPGHLMWGNKLFGGMWDEALVNGMAAFRKMGIYANIYDLYPQFKHHKAFQGWVERQARYLKRTKGVYTNRQLMNEVLKKRPEQIEYYLEKYGKSMKDSGANPTADGVQAKPVEADAKKAVEGVQSIEQTVPRIDKAGKTPIPKQPKIEVGKSKEVEVPVQSRHEKYIDESEELQKYVDKHTGAGPDGRVNVIISANHYRLQSSGYRGGYTEMYKSGKFWIVSASRDVQGRITGEVDKKYKTIKGAIKGFNNYVHSELPPELASFLERGAYKTKLLKDRAATQPAKTKKVTMVDKDAVRPTVDNHAEAKIALEERYPDIKFEMSKSEAVADPAGGKSITPTPGKRDGFNLTFKPKTTAKTPAEGTVAEITLTKRTPIKVTFGKPKLAAKDEEWLVEIHRNKVNQMSGEIQPVADEPMTYKTLTGALKRFKTEVGNKAKTPELDEIKIGPKRGAEQVQTTVEEVVGALKALKDCRNGKSVQSGVPQGDPAAAGAVGRGTAGAN